MQEIFSTFDHGTRKKVSLECLPKILRLLNYNIGNVELQDLMLIVDRKQSGFFGMEELKFLLSNFQFTIDRQKELLEAFRELDHNGDGFIPKEDLKNYMKHFGEPLEDDEVEFLLEQAKLPGTREDAPKDEVDIEHLARIMVPSDDIMDDLVREASE